MYPFPSGKELTKTVRILRCRQITATLLLYIIGVTACSATGLLIAQQVDVGEDQTVTRLVYDRDGGTCLVDESKLPALAFCADVFNLLRNAAFGEFIEEPFFEPDGPSRFRVIYEPVTLSPNQEFFGLIGGTTHHPDLAGYEDYPEGYSEGDFRNQIFADFEVEVNAVALKGSNFAVKGPVQVESSPEEPLSTIFTYFDYTQAIRTPGRHSLIYRWNLSSTQGDCTEDCREAGIWQYEFTIDIVPEGGEGGMAAQAPAPFSEATDMGDGWWASDWFGTFRDQPDDWIHHSEHGPLFIPGPGESDGFWAFDLDLGWLFIGSDFYPFLYGADRAAWLFYEQDSVDPRNFFDLDTEEWITDE